MKIGNDTLEICRIEGYLMMEYCHRKLFPTGNKGKLDKNCTVLFTRTNEETHKTGKYNPRLGNQYVLYEWRSWNDVLDRYLDCKKDIDDYIYNTGENCVDWENLEPSVYDFLHLADAVDSYWGL